MNNSQERRLCQHISVGFFLYWVASIIGTVIGQEWAPPGIAIGFLFWIGFGLAGLE